MTNIPLERIGVIPTGSYFGPAGEDLDGDGVPDTLIRMFGGGWADTGPGAAGSNNLWLEYLNEDGEYLEYSSAAGSALIPTTLAIIGCPGSLTKQHFEPIMKDLTAWYVDEALDPPEKLEHTIIDDADWPDPSLVDMTKQNEDQVISFNIGRTFSSPPVTEQVTVSLKVHLICPEAGDLPECGDGMEGSFEDITWGYPTPADQASTDPDAWNVGLWVCDEE